MMTMSEPGSNTTDLAVGERRQITVVFADIAGFSRLASRIDAEDMAEWLEGFYARARGVIEANGGVVTEILGDGVVGCFGLQSGDEFAASFAVKAALRLVDPLAPPPGDDQPAQLRAGVATGEVATRTDPAFGDLPRVTGKATTLASRIQETGEPGQVLIAAQTRALLRGRFRTVALTPRMLKGFAEPVSLYRVTGPQDNALMPERSGRPFVGRGPELATIADAAQSCLVIGEPGIGKSSLAVEATRHDGVGCWVSGDGLQRASSHFPFRAWLTETLRPQSVSMAALEAAFPAMARDALLPLAMVLGLPEGQRLLAEKSNIALKPMIERSLVQAMRQCMTPGTWIVIEDLHWLDNASFGVLQALLADPEIAPSRVLLTSRDDPKIAGHLAANALCQIRLAPLGPDESAQMLAALNGRQMDADLKRMLLDAAGGIPLYLEHLHQHGVAEGVQIPPTLIDLLSERIDACGGAKPVLQCAAVLGRQFDTRLLARMVGEGVYEGHLHYAAGLGVLERQGAGEWRFAHALLHQAAYHGILRRNRERHHAAVARILTEEFPERAASEPVLLAEHHTRARQFEPAIRAYLTAGQLALFQGALTDAAHHIQTALDLCHSAPPDLDTTDLQITAHTALGSTVMQYQGFTAPQVRDSFDAVQTLAVAVGKPSLDVAPAIFGSFTHAIIAGDMDGCEVFCDLLTDMTQTCQNGADLAEPQLAAMAARICKNFYAGNFPELDQDFAAICAAYDLRRHAPMIGHYGMDLFAAAHMFETAACGFRAQAGRVAALLPEVDAHQDALNMPVMVPYALCWGAVPLFFTGRHKDALARLNRGITEADAQGVVFWQSIGRVWHAVMTLTRHPDAATLSAMRDQLDTLAASGCGIGMPYFEAVHARGLARMGDVGAGLCQSRAAVQACARSRLLCWHAEILRLHALNCRDAGLADESDAALAAGLRLADRQGADLWTLRLLLEMSPDSPGHGAHLRAVCDRVQAAGHVPELVQARKILGGGR